MVANNKLESALKYAKLGWAIIPAIGKNPCVKWKKFQKVAPTENEIKEFWRVFPNAGSKKFWAGFI